MATKISPISKRKVTGSQRQLTAVLEEHEAQVNCIAVSPDQVFFLTGSEGCYSKSLGHSAASNVTWRIDRAPLLIDMLLRINNQHLPRGGVYT